MVRVIDACVRREKGLGLGLGLGSEIFFLRK
jgi:hypothetical protein